ncbi:hypothetical protein Pyn_10298 [Prunus yedoensis var. nudiflora]|uniref:Uncharacterized protein n=1 Tax=Prunus yedoensis var. nudiflora TaxID=2094558 RepID=A0A314XNS9_PRUYE|nr:hypothetical protein Pyn_10298 [Prunus yedoensis var. nudiflora]
MMKHFKTGTYVLRLLCLEAIIYYRWFYSKVVKSHDSILYLRARVVLAPISKGTYALHLLFTNRVILRSSKVVILELQIQSAASSMILGCLAFMLAL